MTDIYGLSILRPKATGVAKTPVENWTWTPFDPANAGEMGTDIDWPYGAHSNCSGRRENDRGVFLILATGVMARELVQAADDLEINYCYFDYAEVMDEGAVTLKLANAGDNVMRLHDVEVYLNDVSAVYYEGHPVTAQSLKGMTLEEQFFLTRWRQILRDLSALMPNAIWIPSHPANGTQSAQNKLAELSIARSAGLSVPDTICTNDPAEVTGFYREKEGRIIFKECSTVLNLPIGFFEPTEEALRQITGAPCVFQEYIEKDYEVRAIIVGDKVLAARVDSQRSEATRLDWRAMNHAEVPWQQVELPADVQAALLRYASLLDMNHGSVDIIRAQDGRYVFLEMNRPGAVYWLKSLVGIDVAHEIASLVQKIDIPR